MSLPSLKQPFVTGSINTPAGKVPQVSATLNWTDHWGTFKARWGVGRMHYAVEPGIYALNRPTEQSPVLVTANYKMSFDCLRQALPGQDAWILVLDVVTLAFDQEKCVGCGMCTLVCPHAVIAMIDGKACIENRDACMECGACARNCPTAAVSVNAGVGCATAVINAVLGRDSSACCCVIDNKESCG